MRETTTYVCDVCNKPYFTKEEALSCEDHHPKVVDTEVYYVPGWYLPTKITLTFDNKHKLEYIRRDSI